MRRCCPPGCPPASQHGAGSPGWGALAEALHGTAWKHVLSFKHVSNSSCNPMLKCFAGWEPVGFPRLGESP